MAPDDDSLERSALALICDSGLTDQVVISSWDQVALSRIRAQHPAIQLAVNLRPRVPDPVGQVRPTGASWVAVWWPQVDRQTVAQLQASGLRVCLTSLFTGDYADAFRLGVDAVTAEDPAAARAALAQREGTERGTIHG